MHALQEKFQITIPAKPEKDDQWVTADSQRCTNGIDMFKIDTSDKIDKRKFNYMPPGMEIDNQEMAEINAMPLSVAGQSDVSADTNPESFARGFKKREMKGTDDQYTGEHVDHFYGDAGGFVERNNYCDRE